MKTLITPTEEITNFVLIGKSSNTNKRLCLHPVLNENIGAEIPFTKDNAKKIFSLFSEYKYDQKEFENIIPKEIIFAKDNPEKGLQLIWVSQKSKKKLFFSEENNQNGLLTQEYILPTLIFKYANQKLYVFAVSDADNGKITNDTELYDAPFLNVFNNGSVCMGNVNLSKVSRFKTFDKCKEFLEISFFNSYFTHSNNKNINTKYLMEVMNSKYFNYKNLIKANKNLNSIL